MNRITAFIIMMLVSGAIITGCKKDNAKLPSDLRKAAVPTVIIEEGTSDTIRNVATFQGKFSVGLYFAQDERPKKMDVVVALNGDYTKVKVLKADVTTYPTPFTVTAQQLSALFGIDASTLKTGDFFEVGADVYMNSGLVVPIFNTVGNPYGPDGANYPGQSLEVIYTVKLSR